MIEETSTVPSSCILRTGPRIRRCRPQGRLRRAFSYREPQAARLSAMTRARPQRGTGTGCSRRNGLDDNTLVMFTSDNGGAGYIALPEMNRPFRGWKITFFEGGIHVPYLMRWPAKIAAGSRFEKPVHHFDIYATAAAAAGASVPADRPMDGVDLLPFVNLSSGEGEGGEIAEARSTDPHDRLFWRSGHYQVVMAEGWSSNERPDPIRCGSFTWRRIPRNRTTWRIRILSEFKKCWPCSTNTTPRRLNLIGRLSRIPHQDRQDDYLSTG